MPQIFHRSFNTVSRASIFGALFALAGLAWAYGEWVRSDYVSGKNEFVEQVVPFSHKHHVGGLGIDCRYCHTSVEKSGFAGIPPTRTCMNCHSQIWVNSPLLEPVRQSYARDEPLRWNRVHNLADFAYFDHSIHLAKGIGCSSCHGDVDDMDLMRQTVTLYMEWCLGCHRDPARHVRPREELFNTNWQPGDLAKRYPGQTREELAKHYDLHRHTDCSTCHR